MFDVRISCQPGDPGRPNEDSVVAVPGLLAVLDGVTVPDGTETGCSHGPAWYSAHLAAQLASGYAAEPATDLAELVAAGIEAVRGEHGSDCDLTHPATPQSTLAMLRIGPDRCDYLLLGDSTIVIDDGETTQAVTDLRSHEIVRRVRGTARPTPIGSTKHAKRIRGELEAVRAHLNRPGGYWVAAADPVAARHAVRGTVPRRGRGALHRAALLTDGAACVVDSYRLTDWPGLLDLVQAHGAAHVIDLARRVERADPEGFAQPRPKRHDDATVVYCRLN
ncbi:MAG TPA: protein phosphatase 2C domain-containing protein [Micromonosporaceae bacterium]|nr:protein phosphatase 2C domain-containing protein [Micromonosporaceae bacterium]